MIALQTYLRDNRARLRRTLSGRGPMRLRCDLLALVTLVGGICLPGVSHAARPIRCNVNTSLAQIAFGTYDPLGTAPLDGVGTLAIVCNKNRVLVTVALDRGNSTTFQPRQMNSGANVLAYNLYLLSPNSGIVFGDGTGGTQTSTAMTTRSGRRRFAAQVRVYGRIQPGENAAIGSYNDTIRVQVTF